MYLSVSELNCIQWEMTFMDVLVMVLGLMLNKGTTFLLSRKRKSASSETLILMTRLTSHVAQNAARSVDLCQFFYIDMQNNIDYAEVGSAPDASSNKVNISCLDTRMKPFICSISGCLHFMVSFNWDTNDNICKFYLLEWNIMKRCSCTILYC